MMFPTSSLRAAFRRYAALGRFTKLILCVSVLLGATAPVSYRYTRDKSKWAPTDYGLGPGQPIGSLPILKLGDVPRATASQAGINPAVGGVFGPAFPWPIIPLHIALLPNGNVLSYGTDTKGNQGALQNPSLAPYGSPTLYDVWTPKLGTGSNAHTTLTSRNVTTDLFCSAISVLGNGNALVIGGDLTVSGQRNFANNKVELFSPTRNTLTSAGQMTYPRWYPSITTLPNGDKLVLGGITNNVGVPTPEVYSATNGWRTLPGISIDPNEWYYPRGFVGPDGAVYLLQTDGIINRLTTDGAGTMTDTGSRLDASDNLLPALMTIECVDGAL
jgi:hypothetical protein